MSEVMNEEEGEMGWGVHNGLKNALKNYNYESLPKELLQNSDDAGSKKVALFLDQMEGVLYHWQSGLLTEKNFRALGQFEAHTKENDATRIGKYGLGFSSVFHTTNAPRCFSAGATQSMDLKTLKIKRFFPKSGQQGVKLEEFSRLPPEFLVSSHEAKGGSLFVFPFRKENLDVNGVSFQVPDVDELLTVFENVIQPSTLLFLRHVEELSISVRGTDGRVEHLQRIKLNSEDFRETRTGVLKALTQPFSVMKPKQVKNVKLTTLDRSGVEASENWWYCVEVGPPLKYQGLPMVLQLSAPQDRLLEPGSAMFAVGLSLTGETSPTLCNCSANLTLDSTRRVINITAPKGKQLATDGSDNRSLLDRLAQLYCGQFLPEVDSHQAGDHFPVDWSKVGSSERDMKAMNLFADDIIRAAVKHKSKFAVRQVGSAPPQTLAFSELSFYGDDGINRKVLEAYQTVALSISGAHPIALLGGASILQKLDALRIEYETFDVDCVIGAFENISIEELDKILPEDEGRYEVLEYILKSFKASERKKQLEGIPLRATTKGWSHFRGNSKPLLMATNDSRKLLLDPSVDVASQETERLFRKYPAHQLATELTLELFFACGGAKQAIPENDLPEFARNLWKFLGEKPKLNKKQQDSLHRGRFLQLTNEKMVKCETAPNLVVLGSTNGDFAIASVLQNVEIDILHQDFHPAQKTLPVLQASASSNVGHILSLLEGKLFTADDADRIQAYVQFYADEVDNSRVRRQLQALPIYKLMGVESTRVSLIEDSGQLRSFIVEERVFQELPPAVKVPGMVGISKDLAAVIGVEAMDEQLVVRKVLEPTFWIEQLDKEARQAVWDFVKRKESSLLQEVFITTHETGHWAQIKELIRAPEALDTPSLSRTCLKLVPSSIGNPQECGLEIDNQLKKMSADTLNMVLKRLTPSETSTIFKAPIGTPFDCLGDYLPDRWCHAVEVAEMILEQPSPEVVKQLSSLNHGWVPGISRLSSPDGGLDIFQIGLFSPEVVYNSEWFDFLEGIPMIRSPNKRQLDARCFEPALRRLKTVATTPSDLWKSCPKGCKLGCAPAKGTHHGFVLAEKILQDIYRMYDARKFSKDGQWRAIVSRSTDCIPVRISHFGRMVAPRSLIGSTMFAPFWPAVPDEGGSFWRDLFSFPDLPKFDQNCKEQFYSLIRWWDGKKILPQDLESLQRVINHVAPYLDSPLPLPCASLKMTFSNKLHFIYGDISDIGESAEQVREASRNICIEPTLNPERFQLPRALELKSLRSVVQRPITQYKLNTCEEMETFKVETLKRIKDPLFSDFIRKEVARIGGKNFQMKPLDQVKLFLTSELTVQWENPKVISRSVSFQPTQALDESRGVRIFINTSPTDSTTTTDQADLRFQVIECLCEFLTLPATFQHSKLWKALKCEDLNQHFASNFPVTTEEEEEEEQGSAPAPPGGEANEESSATRTRQPQKEESSRIKKSQPASAGEQGEGPSVSMVSRFRSKVGSFFGLLGLKTSATNEATGAEKASSGELAGEAPTKAQNATEKAGNSQQAGLVAKTAESKSREKKHQKTRLEKTKSFYTDDRRAPMPKKIKVDPPRPGPDEPDDETESFELETWQGNLSESLPLGILPGLSLPKTWENEDVHKAARSLSTLLKSACEEVEAKAFDHCFLYWTGNVQTKLLAFNQVSTGLMGFNLTKFMDTASEDRAVIWTGILYHEYNHNSHQGHGMSFIHGLQNMLGATSLQVQAMRHTGRENQRGKRGREDEAGPSVAALGSLPLNVGATRSINKENQRGKRGREDS